MIVQSHKEFIYLALQPFPIILFNHFSGSLKNNSLSFQTDVNFFHQIVVVADVAVVGRRVAVVIIVVLFFVVLVKEDDKEDEEEFYNGDYYNYYYQTVGVDTVDYRIDRLDDEDEDEDDEDEEFYDGDYLYLSDCINCVILPVGDGVSYYYYCYSSSQIKSNIFCDLLQLISCRECIAVVNSQNLYCKFVYDVADDKGIASGIGGEYQQEEDDDDYEEDEEDEEKEDDQEEDNDDYVLCGEEEEEDNEDEDYQELSVVICCIELCGRLSDEIDEEVEDDCYQGGDYQEDDEEFELEFEIKEDEYYICGDYYDSDVVEVFVADQDYDYYDINVEQKFDGGDYYYQVEDVYYITDDDQVIKFDEMIEGDVAD
ncbi:MAG: hypothetical protein EZS28_025622 [Streblomastix strix]|uniref:Uncharacterized protein n=1 Tax=Streblomastix strix TaxID=222440 RepID=A0A5J4V8M5_9EUKA|nr:MAG: hypothetical protein EZS28_025622 [Streblomastix strix]